MQAWTQHLILNENGEEEYSKYNFQRDKMIALTQQHMAQFCSCAPIHPPTWLLFPYCTHHWVLRLNFPADKRQSIRMSPAPIQQCYTLCSRMWYLFLQTPYSLLNSFWKEAMDPPWKYNTANKRGSGWKSQPWLSKLPFASKVKSTVLTKSGKTTLTEKAHLDQPKQFIYFYWLKQID